VKHIAVWQTKAPQCAKPIRKKLPKFGDRNREVLIADYDTLFPMPIALLRIEQQGLDRVALGIEVAVGECISDYAHNVDNLLICQGCIRRRPRIRPTTKVRWYHAM
jgi:hypothetical protein